MPATDIDVAIIGAGAAGLATAIFTLRGAPARRVAVLDGARTPGAKILVSGGSRCNVTNASVGASDFNGGRPALIRQILRAFPAASTLAFFREMGVGLHEEALGKIFPDSNRSRDVLQALLDELDRLGGTLRTSHRVHDVSRTADGAFQVATSGGALTAAAVVLATGGLALPKTGSDGEGYGFARRFGHALVPTTPALVPLLVDPLASAQFHAAVSGVSIPARLTVQIADAADARIAGALLWTHFGISGPAALDASRHWMRAQLEGRVPRLIADLAPGLTFETLEASWLDLARRHPRTTIAACVNRWLPESVAREAVRALGLQAGQTLAECPRDTRRSVVHALSKWPIAVTGSRGYAYAEVTAGGIDLPEIDPRTMESRLCGGLFLVGEILDVDGRLGGFNFQWAWATGKVAGDALAARV